MYFCRFIVFSCFLRFALLYTVNFHIVSCGQSIYPSIHPSDRALKAHSHVFLPLFNATLSGFSLCYSVKTFLFTHDLELEKLRCSTASFWLVPHDFAYRVHFLLFFFLCLRHAHRLEISSRKDYI